MRYAQSQARLFAARKRVHPILFPKGKDRGQAFQAAAASKGDSKIGCLRQYIGSILYLFKRFLNQKDDERYFRRINSAKALPNKTSVSKTTNRGLATGTAVTTRNRITGDCVVPATLSMATH